MNDANKYRDLSRYRNPQSTKNDIPLGSNKNAQSKSNLDYKTAQYSRESSAKYAHKHVKKNSRARKRKNFFRTAAVIVVLAVVGLGV